MSERNDETAPLFPGVAPEIPQETRASRRARLSVAAAGAIPIIAAATATWVAGAATLPADEAIGQFPTTPEPTPDALNSVSSVRGATTHTVQIGETVQSIADVHGIPTAALLALNGLSWQTSVHEGQILVVSKTRREPIDSAATAVPRLANSPMLESGRRAHDTVGIQPLSSDMATNARIIISVGRDLGVSNYGIVIALSTAAQESGLRNLDYGDRDSVGLFQQRPSSGWGSASQIRDPRYATRAFFGGPTSPTPTGNPGLLDIDGWQHMAVTEAAQAVQRSAFPDAYAKWEVSAWQWLFDLT